jgi:hypothetical protein
MQPDIEKLAQDAFYLNPEMIKFLLIENLALKMALHNQGNLVVEQFNNYKKEATEVLEKQAKQKIEEWKKSHPQIADILQNMKRDSIRSEDPPVVS